MKANELAKERIADMIIQLMKDMRFIRWEDSDKVQTFRAELMKIL